MEAMICTLSNIKETRGWMETRNATQGQKSSLGSEEAISGAKTPKEKESSSKGDSDTD